MKHRGFSGPTELKNVGMLFGIGLVYWIVLGRRVPILIIVSTGEVSGSLPLEPCNYHLEDV